MPIAESPLPDHSTQTQKPSPIVSRRQMQVGAVQTRSQATSIAIITDVHGNRQALGAVLVAAREAGATELWCLGDVVGYGADPVHCLSECAQRSHRMIAGNHDLGACGKVDLDDFSELARGAIEWTREALGTAGTATLARLSPAAPGAAVPLYHGSPRDPVWEYILSPEQAMDALEQVSEAPLVLVGHTHVPAAWRITPEGDIDGGFVTGEGTLTLEGGRWLVNPGAVGQPRDGDSRAAWARYEPDAGKISFHRTPYDVAGAQEAILSAGLPSQLATRLSEGI